MRPIDADALLSMVCEFYTNCERANRLVFSACEIKQMFADMLNETPTIEQPKWIPVTERLPEPNENPVLAVFFGVVNPAWCYSGLWELPSGIISDKVTHWMPLPEPPKGNE